MRYQYSRMNKTVYGLTGGDENTIVLTPDQIPLCATKPGALTPALLKAYIDRVNSLMATLADTRPPLSTTLLLLDTTRQELCVLTGTTYEPLPPPPEVGIATDPSGGKLTISSTVVAP